MPAPRIHVAAATFEPWRVQALTHTLSDHPLLQIESLVELGKRQQERKLVRTHSADATAGTSFADAPNLHPNTAGAAATLEGIAEARAWMSLLNVQADPIYRAFIDEILDEVRPIVEHRDPGMCYRAGWIFVSSPNAVTPFHMDHEHNFILQIRGTKRLYVWDPFDREVVSRARAGDVPRRALARAGHLERRACGRARTSSTCNPARAATCRRRRRTWSRIGPEPSITISFTYYTDSTRAARAALSRQRPAAPARASRRRRLENRCNATG